MDLERFENRKREHLREALKSEHQAATERDLDQYRLTHEALPDFNLSDADLSTPLLDRPPKTPSFVAGTPARHKDALALTHRTAAGTCSSSGIRSSAVAWSSTLTPNQTFGCGFLSMVTAQGQTRFESIFSMRSGRLVST